MSWLLAVGTVIAIARVTRLITADKVTEPIRDWIDRRFTKDAGLSYLIHCDWCVSGYVGALLGAGSVFLGNGRGWWVFLLAAVGSQLAGLMPRLEAD